MSYFMLIMLFTRYILDYFFNSKDGNEIFRNDRNSIKLELQDFFQDTISTFEMHTTILCRLVTIIAYLKRKQLLPFGCSVGLLQNR